MESVRNIFSHRKFWAKRFGTAPVLPMSRAEMEQLGWDSCDIILVTGDAYIDHPSFGMALIGRLLEAQGFRVGIISQPDWHSPSAFKTLGKPNLFFGVTAGNMDSMVNRYTADRKTRSDDAYTPNAEADKRPDRAVIVYSQRCREAYSKVPVVIGGIEASLRRIAHFDYWSGKVRRSVLPDSKADILLYGNAERALIDLAHRLAKGEAIADITDLRGTAILRKDIPAGWSEIDSTSVDRPNQVIAHPNPYEETAVACVETGKAQHAHPVAREGRAHTVIRLPSFEQVRDDPVLYAHANRLLHLETNPGNARALVQTHGDRDVWINPPPIPLTTEELDGVYALPYTRRPHPAYGEAKIPAYEMIRFSINIMRGCFGGCTFCSITEHEGRIIQNRSEGAILHEIEEIRDKTPGFTGTISDLGGPTANMYRLKCRDPKIESACRRLSCVYPDICINMGTDHTPLIQLYRKARTLPGIKRILIGSGVRYDLAIRSPEYVRELVSHHVGGYLKIAPEHIAEGPLSKMMKPGMGAYDKFKELFEKFSKEAGKEQYLIPYFMSAHPGTTNEDMLELALWLKANGFRLDQVQNFTPTPMAFASAMYHTGRNPLRKVIRSGETMPIPKSGRARQLHKAFLRYHDSANWPLLREALRQMGRADLIGNGKKHLVPGWQPAGTGSPSPSTGDSMRRPQNAAHRNKKPSSHVKPAAAKTKPPRRIK
ncbi:MAG: YgiQ family radical SAM protein [Sulfuricella sp.]|nr:YgiQ family radical SAM protein [Sulfuricella sp.]